MTKYEKSLILSLLIGVLLFLFSFDNSGFSFLLTIPILIFLGIPSILLKIHSKIPIKTGYWDIIVFILYVIMTIMYDFFSQINFQKGDVYWYVNGMFAHQLISSILLMAPITMMLISIFKKNKIK